MTSAVKEMRHEVTGSHVIMLKKVLRQRDIRDTLRHYMGRRNCGTKRTFAYAGFQLDRKLLQEMASTERSEHRDKKSKEIAQNVKLPKSHLQSPRPHPRN